MSMFGFDCDVCGECEHRPIYKNEPLTDHFGNHALQVCLRCRNYATTICAVCNQRFDIRDRGFAYTIDDDVRHVIYCGPCGEDHLLDCGQCKIVHRKHDIRFLPFKGGFCAPCYKNHEPEIDLYKAQRVRIDMEYVVALREERRKVNKHPFVDIVWFQNGQELEIPTKDIQGFVRSGLNNTDFVDVHSDGEVDPGNEARFDCYGNWKQRILNEKQGGVRHIIELISAHEQGREKLPKYLTVAGVWSMLLHFSFDKDIDEGSRRYIRQALAALPI